MKIIAPVVILLSAYFTGFQFRSSLMSDHKQKAAYPLEKALLIDLNQEMLNSVAYLNWIISRGAVSVYAVS